MQNHSKTEKVSKYVMIALIALTLGAFTFLYFCFSSGFFIISQNILYIPIILASLYYLWRGFFLSVAIALLYFLMVLIFTRDTTIILQALSRFFLFSLVAGVLTAIASGRIRAREQLLESEERYRDLFRESYEAVMTLEPPDWKFTSANPAAIKLFGAKDEEEFMSYAPWQLSPETQPDEKTSEKKAFEMIETAMRKGSHVFDWVHKRVGGEEFAAEVVLSRVGQGGKPFLHAVVRDKTERELLEKQKNEAVILKQSAEIRSRFTSMVSHELRSPLSVIRESIDIVLDGLTGEVQKEQRKILEMAKRNTDRLGRLINNVLDFQKIETGKMAFDFHEHDLGLIVREVYENLALLAKDRAIDFVLDASPDLPKVKADRDKIVQVLMNLVNNALKFTEKGKVTVTISGDNGKVRVGVRDTGPGIRTEDLPKLFRAFEQLESSRDYKKGGTGLGLAISKEIILAHHGEIWAESEIGKGATFFFTLPVFVEGTEA